MTALAHRAGPDGWGPPQRKWSDILPTAWPLSALTVLYPLWWMLGLPTYIFAILAVPMAFQLHRRGNVRVPPGFGVWVVLLFWVALSALMLGEVAPGTLPPEGFGRYIAFATRLMNYCAVTVIMLYVLNLGEAELPRNRVVRLLGALGVFTVIGGFVGVLVPHLRFVSPLAQLLPEAVARDPFVQRLMLIEVAQLHDILSGGVVSPRPSAPFEYTNAWGENLCILLVWLAVGTLVLGRGMRRVAGIVLLAAAVVPIVRSLNRGLWIGLAIALLYVALRLAWRGKFGPLAIVFAVVGVFAVLLFTTQLGTVMTQRLTHGHSNDIRSTLNEAAVDAAISSPVVGYGGNRALIGSNRSIAVGKSTDCPLCGNFDIGSDGHLWHLLVSHGFVGALAYNVFFLWNLWRFRRDHSAIGIAASLTIVLLLFFQTVYGALSSALCWGLIAVALLARNERERRRERAEAVRLAAAGGDHSDEGTDPDEPPRFSLTPVTVGGSR